MTIGIYTFELHLPMARSLKEKRQVFRRLKDRLRARYNVAVAESGDHAALWQRGSLTVVSLTKLMRRTYRNQSKRFRKSRINRLSVQCHSDSCRGWYSCPAIAIMSENQRVTIMVECGPRLILFYILRQCQK